MYIRIARYALYITLYMLHTLHRTCYTSRVTLWYVVLDCMRDPGRTAIASPCGRMWQSVLVATYVYICGTCWMADVCMRMQAPSDGSEARSWR